MPRLRVLFLFSLLLLSQGNRDEEIASRNLEGKKGAISSPSSTSPSSVPFTGIVSVTDQDTVLHIDGGGMRVLDIPQTLRARVAPGSRSKVSLEGELTGGRDALRVSNIQQFPSNSGRVAGHRRMTSSHAELPIVSTTVDPSSYESQLLSYYSQPDMRGSNVSVLFLIVSMCGQPPAISKTVSWQN